MKNFPTVETIGMIAVFAGPPSTTRLVKASFQALKWSIDHKKVHHSNKCMLCTRNTLSIRAGRKYFQQYYAIRFCALVGRNCFSQQNFMRAQFRDNCRQMCVV